MNCFPCFSSKNNEDNNHRHGEVPVAPPRDPVPPSPSPQPPVNNNVANSPARPNNHNSNHEANNHNSSHEANNHRASNEANTPEQGDNGARTFTFRELAMATKNFRQEHLLGEGGFGKLYKGTLQTGEVVAVKRLDRIGTQGNKEFSVEVLMLTLLKHPNLVTLMGYCADGEQRLLVYEYLPLGSLKSYVHDLPADRKPLDWKTRMKIASGAAEGLEYLHEKANPAIVYRDLKLSHILVDEDLNPKLSDYGLAKLAQGDSKSHLTARVMGSGYCAPEYERHGELTTKSDIYSFGVVLLELITGRKAMDTSRPIEEQNLVVWAQSFFKDPKRFPEMADPLLKKQFSERNLNQAVGIAAMCLQDEPSVRPLIGDLVALLSFLAVAPKPEETMAHAEALAAEQKKLEEHSDSSDDESGESQYEHDSDNESNGGSESSDDEDGQHHQQHLHQESKKLEKKSSSAKYKKNKSKKPSSSRKVKKLESDISFTSSSSSRSNHSMARDFSVNSRQDSINEGSQHGSFSSSLGNGKYEESFAWSMGSSAKYKSGKGSGRVNSRPNKNKESHGDESEGENYSSSDSSGDEIEHKSKS